MIEIIINVFLICIFFILGLITQAFKKAISIIITILLKLCAFLGIKITREKTVEASEEFKHIYIRK